LNRIFNDRIIQRSGKLFTKSSYSRSVYGEQIIRVSDYYLRYWNPKRSKLSAAILLGLKHFWIEEDSSVLYLGASTGTTVSHISDIAHRGTVFAVEVSYEPFSKLLKLSESRDNILPILEDARNPDRYGMIAHGVNIIYQDISQRDQIEIFNSNSKEFRTARSAILILKLRSIDSSRNDMAILSKSIRKIEGFVVVETVDLNPYDSNTYMVILRRK